MAGAGIALRDQLLQRVVVRPIVVVRLRLAAHLAASSLVRPIALPDR
jgi:hypothetical protein